MKIMKRRTGGLRSLITERKALSVFLLVLVLPSSAFAACEDWVARIVSIQGSVDIRASGTQAWQVAGLQQTYCEGDVIRVNATSRAALELHNETIIRLNQNSTLILSGPKKDVSWLDLIKGSLHAITRVPRSLKIKTPFVNAAVEGTEFQVQVKEDNTLVGVIEGIVKVSNEYGNLLLAQDQSAITYKGNAPVLRLDIKPADSVHWSLYYPRLNVGGLQQVEDLISAGQVEEAEIILASQTSAEAFSLKTIIAIANNRKQQALDFSAQAIRVDQNSVAGYMARSYALQANFELHPALKAAQKAVSIDGQHTLAWVRLAELYLTLGDIDKGLAAARKAVELKPDLARTQVILGYAHLLQHNTKKARQVFARSIKLDSSDPLARLGTGLAEIRGGNLRKGRREIEIAASLDTNNAQIRSYLGKAYLEEKRNKLAADQFALAKQMDPNDPTPWLYNALRKQSENKPIEALNELQQSIKLNNNRAVYRSSFQLDDDRATRGAGLGRIYQELGFEQLALKEATRS
ncbi:MAG: tetratricopeptide repeat protein, partial [Gammaproteobacteria bacterium]|nr:tetratricopeptide repeat protein [Gammaproteobacteria bacterium]